MLSPPALPLISFIIKEGGLSGNRYPLTRRPHHTFFAVSDQQKAGRARFHFRTALYNKVIRCSQHGFCAIPYCMKKLTGRFFPASLW